MTQPDEKLVYKFNESAMRVGDILLSTDQTAKASKAIRIATNSPYSHAAICNKPPEFLEAIGSGVSRLNMTRFFVRDRSCVAILRLATNCQERTIIAAKAAENADQYLGNDYWLTGALASLGRVKPARARDAVFCSQLVAIAYENAGIRLCEDKSPEKVVPADLAASGMLENVTDDVLEPVALSYAILWGVPLDEGLSKSRHQCEIEISRQLRNQVNVWLKKQGLPEENNFFKLLNTLRDLPSETQREEMDIIFRDAADRTKYFDIISTLYSTEHSIRQFNRILCKRLEDHSLTQAEQKDLTSLYKDRYLLVSEDLKDKTYLAKWYDDAWKHRQLESFRLLAKNQWKVCSISKRILEDIEACLRSLGVDASS